MKVRRFGRLLIAFLLAVSIAGIASAQRRGFGRQTIRWAKPDSFDGSFSFCRLFFRYQRMGDGGGWGVDYDKADINFTFRLSELTTTTVSRESNGDYNHVVVTLTEPEIFHCPFVMMTEPGGTYFDEVEAKNLHDYLLKGGFLWADDFWGDYAFDIFAGELAKAFPPSKYPIVDVPLEHELFHELYDVKHIPQIPSIGFWFGTGGQTSERGAGSAVPHVRAIKDEDGRIMVLMTHNTDFGDAFEREGENHEYFLQFAPDGYAFGVNALIYAMTH